MAAMKKIQREERYSTDSLAKVVSINNKPRNKNRKKEAEQTKRPQHQPQATSKNIEVKPVMPIHTLICTSDAVRKYCEAFPSLSKDQGSPMHYCLPPPTWCRRPLEDNNRASNMKGDLQIGEKIRKGKRSVGKQRRNTFHGQRKRSDTKRRCQSHRSNMIDEPEPEWLTSDGQWSLETHDPVEEFIRALALDEGYVTCDTSAAPRVPSPTPSSPDDRDLYAEFEAKFDSSLEALWRSEPAPSPTHIWAMEEPLPDGLQPLQIDSFDEPRDRGLRALNHSRKNSSFVEVTPQSLIRPNLAPRWPPQVPSQPAPTDDPLTSARTHFRPIGSSPSEARYADGATFRLEPPSPGPRRRRTRSGSVYIDRERYWEFTTSLSEPPLLFRSAHPSKAVQTDGELVWGACSECSRGGKKRRATDIWSPLATCGACGAIEPICETGETRAGDDGDDEEEWAALEAAIVAATTLRKRRAVWRPQTLHCTPPSYV